MFKYTFTVVAPEAKTVTFFFREQLEDREVDAIAERLGEVATVKVAWCGHEQVLRTGLRMDVHRGGSRG